MGMLKEFKEFAMRGNVVDLAVGVVIGAAFGRIVTALVDGIVMPIVGVALGAVGAQPLVPLLGVLGLEGLFVDRRHRFISPALT